MQNGEGPQESLKDLNEILLPKNTVRAFGRGLRQSMSSALEEGNASLEALRGEPNYQRMEKAFKKILRILDRLEKAKEVRLVLSGAGSDFEFSEETEEEEPKQGELLIDNNITPKFINALYHTIRNPLSIVSGFAEIIQSEEAKRIINPCSQIKNVLESLNNAQEIKMITDIHGNTTITPIRDPDN